MYFNGKGLITIVVKVFSLIVNHNVPGNIESFMQGACTCVYESSDMYIYESSAAADGFSSTTMYVNVKSQSPP